MRLLIAASIAIAVLAPAAHAQSTVAGANAGSYLAMRIDSAALPLSDRVTDDDGTTYLVEFERLVLTLRSGNKFRASVRFRRTMGSNDPRTQARATPIQTMAVSGSYEVVGTEIRFRPDSSRDTRGLKMLTGKVVGTRRISVPFDYRNGAVQRRRVLELHRRDDIL